MHDAAAVETALKNAVETLCTKGLILRDEGVFTKEGEGTPLKIEGNDRLRLITTIIPLIFRRSQRSTVGSYGAKHLLERQLAAGYISNGEAIAAMVALGYKWKAVPNSPNMAFYGTWVFDGEVPFKLA